MNMTNIYHLIIAKQGSSPNKAIRDIVFALLITTAVLLIGSLSDHPMKNEEFVFFSLGM